jgi:hypothetical protein
MEIKDFIGKEVMSTNSKQHYIIEKIDGTFISARATKPSENGTYAHYRWMTGTAPYDNAIVAGELVFIDETLFEPFKEIYEEYRMTDGRYDAYFYNMCHFD